MAVGICEVQRRSNIAHCKDRLAASYTRACRSLQANAAGNWLRGTETKPQDDNG